MLRPHENDRFQPTAAGQWPRFRILPAQNDEDERTLGSRTRFPFVLRMVNYTCVVCSHHFAH